MMSADTTATWGAFLLSGEGGLLQDARSQTTTTTTRSPRIDKLARRTAETQAVLETKKRK